MRCLIDETDVSKFELKVSIFSNVVREKGTSFYILIVGKRTKFVIALNGFILFYCTQPNFFLTDKQLVCLLLLYCFMSGFILLNILLTSNCMFY